MLRATELAGFIGAALAGAAYVPQIWHLISERCSAGLSRVAFAVWLAASLLVTTHTRSRSGPRCSSLSAPSSSQRPRSSSSTPPGTRTRTARAIFLSGSHRSRLAAAVGRWPSESSSAMSSRTFHRPCGREHCVPADDGRDSVAGPTPWAASSTIGPVTPTAPVGVDLRYLRLGRDGAAVGSSLAAGRGGSARRRSHDLR
ncbi:MAG: PQ-loop domain-containing transporter [Acidimicrobiales bacterium]